MDPILYKSATSGYISLFSDGDYDSSFFLQETSEKNTALHVAVQYKQKEFVEKIIELHPQLLYQQNSKGETPLHIAAKVGCLETVQLLVNSAKYESREAGVLRMMNSEMDTALHEAVRNNNSEVVKVLVREDKEVTNYSNSAGESPLFVAVDRLHFDIAAYILEAAPECSYQGSYNMNALHAAVIRSQLGSQFSVVFGTMAGDMRFQYAFACLPKNYLRNVQNLLGDIFSLLNEEGIMIKLITVKKEAITGTDELGWTPLHYAAYLGHEQAVVLFLATDLSVAYMKDKEGMSALHIAAKKSRVSVVDILSRACPDTVELMNNKGQTALHVAAQSGSIDAVKHILNEPSFQRFMGAQDKEGNTALHLAAIQGYVNIVKILANDENIDKVATNKEGLTASDIIATMDMHYLDKARLMYKLMSEGGQLSLRQIINEERRITENKMERGDGQSQETESRGIPGKIHLRPANGGQGKLGFTDQLKIIAEIDILVATIIATVTFSAGIAMPGGYRSDGNPYEGTAILSKNSAFRAFAISNTLSFGCSVTAVILHLAASFEANAPNYLLKFYRYARHLTGLSVVLMMIAFLSGTHAVLNSSPSLANASLVIGCLFFLLQNVLVYTIYLK